MALSAMKSLRRRSHTYEVEIVAQYAAELPPGVAFAGFQMKRKGRLSVADAVGVAGGEAEWNTVCRQTASLQKDAEGRWRPKEFVFKVKAFDRAGSYQHGRTVAKAALDLSPYCMPEPFGPRQMTIPLRPQGLLTVSIRTRWLQNYDRDTDALTDASLLSAAPTSTTGFVGSAADDQDLEGFEGMTIKAVYPAPPAQQPPVSSPTKRPLSAQLRGGSSKARAPLQETQTAQRPASGGSTGGGSGFAGFGNSHTSGGGGGRARSPTKRPPGANALQLGDCAADYPQEPSEGAAEQGGLAPTPTLILGAGRAPWAQQRAQHAPQPQLQEQQFWTPPRGVPPEQWSPIDLEEAHATLANSDEEEGSGPERGRRWRSARSFMRWWGGAETDGSPGGEHAAIERETSLAELKRRSRRLLAERDEARAEGYAARSEVLCKDVELGNMARTKAMLAERLAVTEERLMALCKDEASGALVAALVDAKVAVAEKEYAAMQLQGEVRRYRAQVEALHAKLTRLETEYRTSLNWLGPAAAAAAAEAAAAAAASYCSEAASADRAGGGAGGAALAAGGGAALAARRGAGDGAAPGSTWCAGWASAAQSCSLEAEAESPGEGHEGLDGPCASGCSSASAVGEEERAGPGQLGVRLPGAGQYSVAEREACGA